MLGLAEPQKLTPMRGERNYLVYIPLGVGVVVPPWNFPSGIRGGLVVAAGVTGNSVVLKPASDSPTIAAKFIDILYEAGFPKEAVNFVTGSGGAVGDTLVTHPKTRYVGFTGSKEVGLRISELAAKPSPGQLWIKRTVLEMGGKDAIVVDEEADIDSAVDVGRSEEHTSELQSRLHLVCRLLLEKTKYSSPPNPRPPSKSTCPPSASLKNSA